MTTHSGDDNPLDAYLSPSHSFPKEYPHVPDDDEPDPFPCKLGRFTSPELVWARKPSTSVPSYEIDDARLAARFSSIGIEENHLKRKRSMQGPGSLCNPSCRGRGIPDRDVLTINFKACSISAVPNFSNSFANSEKTRCHYLAQALTILHDAACEFYRECIPRLAITGLP